MSFEFLTGVLAGVGLSMIGSWVMDRARFRHPTSGTDARRRTDTAPGGNDAAPPW